MYSCTSSESGYSSSSDYYPEPSSVESNERLTSSGDVEKRRVANSKNSRNYNRKKKSQEAHLQLEVVEKREKKKTLEKKNFEMESLLREGYTYFGTVIYPPAENIFDEFRFGLELAEIDRKAKNRERMDRDLHLLRERYRTRLEKHEKAAGDLKLKKICVNTYGSRKSRTLHAKNIAQYEFELARFEHKFRRLENQKQLMTMIKQQFSGVFNLFNTPFLNWQNLDEAGRQRFEELIVIFKKQTFCKCQL